MRGIMMMLGWESSAFGSLLVWEVWGVWGGGFEAMLVGYGAIRSSQTFALYYTVAYSTSLRAHSSRSTNSATKTVSSLFPSK